MIAAKKHQTEIVYTSKNTFEIINEDTSSVPNNIILLMLEIKGEIIVGKT